MQNPPVAESAPLFVQVTDPSGHSRVIKLTRFPFRWGTRLGEAESLRDPKIEPEGIQIFSGEKEFVLRIQQTGLVVEIGDLKLHALEIPLRVPLRVGDTELRFTREAPARPSATESVGAPGTWLTVSRSGQELLNTVRRASQSRLSIYLTGETGTGKEVLARMIHDHSPRSTGSFIALNCGALPLSLAESELFGHVKGSFTGAVRDRPGAFLQAHNGTLFLDEVGDLPPEIQVQLLRFLESGEIRPVGGDRVLHADVRVVCATHKPLLRLVQEGKFRQDLYYRLASVPVEIPSLRARPDDIEFLALKYAREQEKELTPEAVRRLRAYPWPGNVRELRHAVERAAGLAGPFEMLVHARDLEFLRFDGLSAEQADEVLPGVQSIAEMEKVMILRALKFVGGNRTDAARVLGVARSTLFEMMKRHRILGPKAANQTAFLG
jgi:two-component system NtrC family response regulator